MSIDLDYRRPPRDVLLPFSGEVAKHYLGQHDQKSHGRRYEEAVTHLPKDAVEGLIDWADTDGYDHSQYRRALAMSLKGLDDEFVRIENYLDEEVPRTIIRRARAMADAIQNASPVPRLYRGMILDHPPQVGDIYESVLESWSEKEDLALDFAWQDGRRGDRSAVVLAGQNIKAVPVTDLMRPGKRHPVMEQAKEYLSAGRFRVTSVEFLSGFGHFVIVEQLSAQPVATSFFKHLGPGPHPSGSDQLVHGSRGSGTSAPTYRFRQLSESGGAEPTPYLTEISNLATNRWASPAEALAELQDLKAHLRSLAGVEPVKPEEPRGLYGGQYAPEDAKALVDQWTAANEKWKQEHNVWEIEVINTSQQMERAAKAALPEVIERGKALSEKVEEALASWKSIPQDGSPSAKPERRKASWASTPEEVQASLTEWEANPDAAELVKKFRTVQEKYDAAWAAKLDIPIYEVRRLIDTQRERAGEAWADPNTRPHDWFVVDRSDLKPRLDSRERRRLQDIEDAWGKGTPEYEEAVADFNEAVMSSGYNIDLKDPLQATRMSATPVAFSPTPPDVGSDKMVLRSRDYYNLLAGGHQQLAKSAQRYSNQREALWQQLQAKEKFSSENPTTIVREVLLAEGIKLGGDLKVTTPRAKGALALKEQMQFVPTAWIEASNETGPLAVESRQARAHYMHDTTVQGAWRERIKAKEKGGSAKIRVWGSFEGSDILHEFGHRVEATNPDVLLLERVFYDQRTVGESLQTLPGYSSSEKSRPDKFGDKYMGKPYQQEKRNIWDRTSYGSLSTFEAYELLSMGLPDAFHMKRSYNLDNDLESRYFTYGLLDLTRDGS